MTSQSTTKTAWNPTGIAWLTFFLGFFPAGIFYAINWSKLGKPQLKWRFIVGVAAAFILLLILVFTFYLNEKNLLSSNIIAALFFYYSQRATFDKFLKDGGKKASFKLPILYSVIFVGLLNGGIYGFNILQTRQLILINGHIVFENKYISATVPKGWHAYKNDPGDTDTIIQLFKENGIATISIDHDQKLINILNATTIQNSKPKDILDGQLKSIEEGIKADPNLNWKNFKRAGEIQEITIQGLPAATGTFIVDENILGAKEKTERKIKRIAIFTHNDLFNIVFAATDINRFPDEEKEFNEFMTSLTIK